MHTSSEAADRLLRRRKGRRNLADFCRFVRKGYVHAPHHAELCRTLDMAARREVTRVIIECPPRVGKSYHVSEAFPAMALGMFPHENVIAASHSDTQARRFGRKVRTIVQSPEYQELFPNSRLDKSVTAQDEFMTAQGGLYLAVGIHGSFMGQGGHIIIIDDPFRSRRDADSPTIRANVQSALDDLENRLEPNAVLIIMHTRWHDDDLVGYIERERINKGIEQWHRVTFPMIRNECPKWSSIETGQQCQPSDVEVYSNERALWPERYDLEACRKIRRKVPPRTWLALYQQKPHEEEGGFFKKLWLNRFAPTASERDGGPPKNVRTYLTGDYGVKAGGDTTEFYRVDIDERGHWWVTDAWIGSEDASVWCTALTDLIEQHNPDAVTGESGVIKCAVEPFLNLMMAERVLATVFLWANRNANKQAMAVPLQGIASMGRLHIAHGSWGDHLVRVLCSFPTSSDDHGVDALANLALCMEQTPGAFALPAKTEETRPDRWEQVLRKARTGGVGTDSWKVT